MSVRRHATALYADIASSTELVAALGAEVAHELIGSCLRDLREIAERFGARVVQSRGDGVLAVFGLPISQEDSARAALNASLAMLARWPADSTQAETRRLALSIGVASGRLVSSEPGGGEVDVTGDAANLAARLSDRASGGQILVSESTRMEVGAQFEFSSVGPVAIKGLPRPIPLYRLNSRALVLQREVRDPSATATAMFGREPELARLQSSVARLSKGDNAVLLLVGDAGIGKTRLLSELTTQLADAAHFLIGAALESSRSLPFDTFGDLIRRWSAHGSAEASYAHLIARLDPLLGDARNEIAPFLGQVAGLEVDEPGRRLWGQVPRESLEAVVRESAVTFLEALSRDKPVVLIAEDFHWADDSSVALLVHLAAVMRNVGPNQFLQILSMRPEGLDRVGDRSDGHSETIHLRPLTDSGLRELIRTLDERVELSAATRDRILAASGGNPLFAEELVRVLRGEQKQSELPGTIEQVVLARADQLPSEPRRLLEVLSVLGTQARVDDLRRIADEPTTVGADIDVLAEEDFVTRSVGSGAVAPRHPAIREALYQSLLDTRRTALHARVARDLDELGVGRDRAALLAFHYSRGACWEELEPVLFRAGEQAASTAANSEALHFFEDAVHHYLAREAEPDPRRVLELRRAVALAHYHRGSYAESLEVLDEVLDRLGVHLPHSTWAGALRFAWNLAAFLVTSRVYGQRTPRRRADERDRQVLELLLVRARAQTTAATARFLFDSMEALRRTHEVSPESIPNAASNHAGAVGPFSYGGLSFSIGQRCIDRALTLVDKDDVRDLLFTRVMSHVHHTLIGDWSASHEIDDDLLERGLRLGLLWEVSTHLGMRTMQEIHRGNAPHAFELIGRLRTIELRFDDDYARSNRRGFTAFAHIQNDDLEQGLEAAREYEEGHDEPALRTQAIATQVKALSLLGRASLAAEALERCEREARRSGILPPFQSVTLARARVYVHLDRIEVQGPPNLRGRIAVRSDVRRLMRLATKVAWEQPEAWRLAGDVNRALGKADAAARSYGRAIESTGRLSAIPEADRSRRRLAALRA